MTGSVEWLFQATSPVIQAFLLIAQPSSQNHGSSYAPRHSTAGLGCSPRLVLYFFHSAQHTLQKAGHLFAELACQHAD